MREMETESTVMQKHNFQKQMVMWEAQALEN